MVKKAEKKQVVAIILMTYGSPETLTVKGVHQYLKNIYHGKDPEPNTVVEFLRRYTLVGGSPLIKITKEQASALTKELNKGSDNRVFKAFAGMRFSPPYIKDIVKKLPKNTSHIVGIIMSPQYSPLIMKGYINELTDAVNELDRNNVKLSISTDWHLEPHFLKALSQRVTQALSMYDPTIRHTVPVLFSAHSMPKRVIEKEPKYIKDLQETAAEVAKLAGLSKKQWLFCYQSAGHTPEKWLKPDFADIMPELQKKGAKNIVIAPVQFLAEHLETLYDIDIAARKQAEECGIRFTKIEALNTSPLFIKALATLVFALI